MKEYQDIYQFVETQSNAFETDEIKVGENFWFNFRKHVQLIFHLKNGMFFTGANDWMRAFREVMNPIIELANWTEDIEVKDTTFFIEGDEDRALSFVINKYHDEVYTRENDLDKMYDEITESDNTYGGVLVQKGAKRPEIIQLNRIDFCDQTQILGGPLALSMNFSPSELRQKEKYGWGKEQNGATMSLEDLCYLASYDKDTPGTMASNKNQVPGKTIKVSIVRGDMPESWLKDDGDEEKFVAQIQVIALYTDEKDNKKGVTLYRKEDKEGFKFFSSNEVEGRALGRGVGEKMIHPQIWTNWKIIHKNSLLEAASKVPLVTDDPSYTNKNKVIDMENLEVTTIEEGKKIGPIPTAMVANIQMFERAIQDEFQGAQFIGQAYDSLMGKEESSGTTFRGQERLVQQGRGSHDKRRGQRAKFIEELYRDWIIPDMVKQMNKGKKFWATLSLEELNWVADQLAVKQTNEKIKEMVLSGKLVTKEEQDAYTQLFRTDLLKKGNKHLVEVLKGELEGIEDRIGINISGKQRNLAGISDRILSIIQFAMANPQFRANLEANGMMGAFNDILEYGGLSPADFATVVNTQPVLSPIQQPQIQAPQLQGQMMQQNART